MAERRGRQAEMLAAMLLRAKGYRILEQRFRCAAGEIDIIAQRRHMFVFVEVKARKTNSEALESITRQQQKRIENAADIWLQTAPLNDFDVRFDVITVVPFQLPAHMVDAWRPGW